MVIDAIDGNTCVTKLLARFDQELKKRLPETYGFYWERHPPIVIEKTDSENTKEKAYDIITVDDKGQWRSAIRPEKPEYIDSSFLRSDPRIGQFAFAINLTESPVSGGIRLHNLQQRAGDIPLWRDQIPELSIKVMKDGSYQRFQLVSRSTPVEPIRGRPVTIDVDRKLTLPAGRPFYLFPLFLGESANDLGFSARLDSHAFPLKETVECKLHLTFEYGADDPYKLVFIPLDKSFPPIRATWRRAEEIIDTDAPAPEYPAPMTWADLRRVPKQNSNETSDLLEWVQNAIARLDQDFYIRPKPRITGVICREWLTDKKGGHFTFLTCNATSESVFIHENSFIRGFNYIEFTGGTSISFELQEREGKYSAWNVAGQGYKEAERLKEFDEESARSLAGNIRKRLYFPVIQVWRDGRSIGDQECPKEYAIAMRANVAYLAALLRERDLPESITNEIRFLLSCMHKDAVDECVQWINEQVENNNVRRKQAVGFALGDVSEQWQKNLLSKLVTHPTNDVLRVFAYAVWREQHFIERFSFHELQSFLNELKTLLGSIKLCPSAKDKWTILNWIRATTKPLELCGRRPAVCKP